MVLSLSSKCAGCGTKYVDDQLWFVDGDWFCRDCLWDRFYTKVGGLFYCSYFWDRFVERYPDGLEQIRHIFRNEPTTGDDHVEEFISENLEHYCDWVIAFGNNESLVKATFEKIGRIINGRT